MSSDPDTDDPTAPYGAKGKAHAHYNAAWADDEYPEMTREEFAKAVRLVGIDIEEVGEELPTLSMFFDAGNLFGGHGLSIWIDAAGVWGPDF